MNEYYKKLIKEKLLNAWEMLPPDQQMLATDDTLEKLAMDEKNIEIIKKFYENIETIDKKSIELQQKIYEENKERYQQIEGYNKERYNEYTDMVGSIKKL